MVDEVEQAVVGPLHVLEDEHERTLLCEALEEAPPGCERLLSPVADGRPVARLTDERRRWARPSRASSVDQLLDRAPQLCLHLVAGSVSRIPACAFTISAERPVADAFAVGQ